VFYVDMTWKRTLYIL